MDNGHGCMVDPKYGGLSYFSFMYFVSHYLGQVETEELNHVIQYVIKA